MTMRVMLLAATLAFAGQACAEDGIVTSYRIRAYCSYSLIPAEKAKVLDHFREFRSDGQTWLRYDLSVSTVRYKDGRTVVRPSTLDYFMVSTPSDKDKARCIAEEALLKMAKP